MRGKMIGVAVVLIFSVWANASLVGLWEFNDPSNLTKATIGNDLELVGTASAIEGYAPGDGAVSIGVGSYFKLYHGIEPDLYRVNVWSLLIDIKYPVSGVYHAIFQTNIENTDDADYFIANSDAVGIAALSYSRDHTQPNVWYRMIISMDNYSHYELYVNGESWRSVDFADPDGRFSIDELYLLLFADNDGEDSEVHVSNIAFWDHALSDDEAAALGGVGNPIPEPATVLLAVLGLGFIRRR